MNASPPMSPPPDPMRIGNVVPHRRRWRLAGWILLVALLSGHFALVFQHNATPFLDAGAYTRYEAKRPYQYRVLMAPVMGVLIEAFEKPGPRALLGKLPAFVATPDAAAYLLIDAVAFAASCFLMAAVARRAVGAGPPALLAVSIYIALVYLFLCLNPNLAFILPYDVPGLALAQACLLCLLTGRMTWLYPLFALATLNRETVLLVVVFIAARALFEPAERRGALRHAIGLGLVWLAIKFGLYLRFSHLESDEGMRLAYNLRTLAKPWQWPALTPLVATSAWVCRSAFTSGPGRAWAVTGSIGFLLVFAVGQITETRAFAELTTYFAVAMALACRPAGSGPPR